MNIVLLIGRLTRDIELRYIPGNQTAVTSFNIAVDRYGDGTDFPRCKVFGKVAENMEKYCHKGSRVAIVGRVETGSYEKDGKTIYTQEIVCNRVEFLDNKQSTDDEATEVPNFNEIKEDVPF